jgi:hypothetical protein
VASLPLSVNRGIIPREPLGVPPIQDENENIVPFITRVGALFLFFKILAQIFYLGDGAAPVQVLWSG